ncbi:three-Cys-motif partner protein TcmP [Lichenihabitans sp. PAMC28606]|uniref:three-Cys-motif partner protein TcmP n=1 Tax=Lichenihabitans sp. PAMC28606 TaxID=2880932 RepID=UPI001D09CE5C|nr:three-Cys-motif partner protein TcmP [Lichenihabitans sp. PAMC28606]UDL93340.1 three-Cys-motif partner protein TcmP [Lichenihabitans sp. PAMC28606]
MIGELDLYRGREQAYVKHFLLSEYLETWAHKVGSHWTELAYVDGFSGPWQSAGERFEDTSFGIALGALTRAKTTWSSKGKPLKVSAYLVEKDRVAYQNLQAAKVLFPNVEIKTYPGSFIDHASTIQRDIPKSAFAFFFVDPKGWAVDMRKLAPLLRRPDSEVVFNFMFDFVNRFAKTVDPKTAESLDLLFDDRGWRAQLNVPVSHGMSTAEYRKKVIVNAFSASLRRLGGYKHVAETTVLRPTMDRPLYSLVYGTRSSMGLEVFRNCQIKTLRKQADARGVAKLNAAVAASDQGEMFRSLTGLAPNPAEAFLGVEECLAQVLLRDLIPASPAKAAWCDLWPKVMEQHVVGKARINQFAGDMRRAGTVSFTGWGARQRSPDDKNLASRAVL